ncbi:uncharacterized protein BT62DRAFT_1014202 [Guyanagaster necrorhizus]|uniref:Uncharacterized protein n=1 Tax=Guyanagaster necrorhizus TaxID=856835 RepID=A0A9P7VEQ9_9AGAR|nr:uncharacterized protein BT62DRAFT_1014202 [Guyanagaster necrorhizus MCA 3950]KAG7439247.1 hypothetical protein BT62DRAFT_1014202 [Guyanagaster necrorhizus MCA 3950]
MTKAHRRYSQALFILFSIPHRVLDLHVIRPQTCSRLVLYMNVFTVEDREVNNRLQLAESFVAHLFTCLRRYQGRLLNIARKIRSIVLTLCVLKAQAQVTSSYDPDRRIARTADTVVTGRSPQERTGYFSNNVSDPILDPRLYSRTTFTRLPFSLFPASQAESSSKGAYLSLRLGALNVWRYYHNGLSSRHRRQERYQENQRTFLLTFIGELGSNAPSIVDKTAKESQLGKNSELKRFQTSTNASFPPLWRLIGLRGPGQGQPDDDILGSGYQKPPVFSSWRSVCRGNESNLSGPRVHMGEFHGECVCFEHHPRRKHDPMKRFFKHASFIFRPNGPFSSSAMIRLFISPSARMRPDAVVGNEKFFADLGVLIPFSNRASFFSNGFGSVRDVGLP